MSIEDYREFIWDYLRGIVRDPIMQDYVNQLIYGRDSEMNPQDAIAQYEHDGMHYEVHDS